MSVVEINTTPHIQTSLVEVTDKLSFKPPCKIYFKNELEQPSGSFKIRGIGYMISTNVKMIKNKNSFAKIRVYASSGGNAGLSAAYLAKILNIKCIVAVPKTAKRHIIEKLKQYGSEVIIFGDSINEADKFLKIKMESDNNEIEKIYCHPFDNELVWQGHSTMIDEIYQQLPNPNKLKGLVCSIGGGGLYNGLMKGLKKYNLKTDILLIETNQAPTFKETIKRREVFTLNNVKSIASSLACSFLSQQSLNYYLNEKPNDFQKTKFESIDDKDSINAVVDHYFNFNQIIEPACGAALSVVNRLNHLLLKNFGNVNSDDAIVIVVCGGSCTNEQDLRNFIDLVDQNRSKL